MREDVVHSYERQIEAVTYRLRHRYSRKKRAYEPRPVRYGNELYIF